MRALRQGEVLNGDVELSLQTKGERDDIGWILGERVGMGLSCTLQENWGDVKTNFIIIFLPYAGLFACA